MSSITLILIAISLLGEGSARAEGSLSFGKGCDTSRIGKSPDMQRAFRAISAKIGRPITLGSCYRSQGTQNEILERNKSTLTARKTATARWLPAPFTLMELPATSP